MRRYRSGVLVDVAINPFEADLPDMIAVARGAEDSGASAVWVADHFSGAVVDAGWSRDPFVCLGGFAASTSTIDLGILVANLANRHPAQLASAVNSVQSLAPGRVRLGVGSGAAPGSRFAVEHEAIGRTLGDGHERRTLLVDSIAALRAIWVGRPSADAATVGFDGLDAVIDDAPCPPIIVGASAWPTIETAVRVADGVNIRAGQRMMDHLDRLDDVRPCGFEVSVLDGLIGEGPDIDELEAAGCDRLILGVSAPFDLGAISSVLGEMTRSLR